ncbi:MAG: phosphotransferase [Myxococcales bacterium]|nr:phosphotransferase [Myxococcales bacterium]
MVRQAAGRDDELARRIQALVRDVLGAQAIRIAFLPAQLGMRRFARVTLEGGPVESLVARVDAPEDPAGRPPGISPEPPLEPLRALLEAQGLPVPACYGGNTEGHVLLLEDVGTESLEVFAQTAAPDARRALYAEACDLIPRLQRVSDAEGRVEAFRRRLDAAHFRYKADLFCTWSLAARGRAASAAERACVETAFACIAREMQQAPARLAHRDFQSANLYVRPARQASGRLVMIDLQGALLAPPEYDLVCLLRDSYVDLPENEIEAHAARVRPALPDAPDRETFARRFDLLTLTRKGKDHARFLYAAQERGDTRYLEHLPRTARQLRGAATRCAAREPRFAALAELIHALPESPCAE